MRHLAETLLPLDADNATVALQVADAVGAALLRTRAIAYCVAHAPAVSARPGFRDLQRRAPALAEELVLRVQRHEEVSRARAADAEMLRKRKEARAKQRETELAAEKAKQDPWKALPWTEMALLAVLVAVYFVMQKYTTAIGPAIPVINLVVILLTALIACWGGFFPTQ
jgi:hypothetical protein